MKSMTPIKKIILGLAAITIVLSIITTNNVASVMMIMASRNNGANTQAAQNNSVQNGDGSVAVEDNGSTDAGLTDNGTTDTGATDTGATNDDSAASGDAGAGDTGATNNGGAADNSGAANNDAPAKNDGKFSDKELVDMYKKAVTKAKTSAKSVVRVKDGALNYKGIVKAGKLSSVGESLMGMFMVGSESEIKAKNEPWEKEKLPPENATCNLTVNGIQKVSYVEQGNNYVITVVAKNAKNPKAGSDGVGSVANVIQEETITGSISSVPGLELKNISLAYENVTNTITIDKATGNLVKMNVNAPCILSLDAKVPLLGSIDGAQVGIQVITEYTVAY